MAPQFTAMNGFSARGLCLWMYTDRICKYNRLLRIEEELDEQAVYGLR